MADNENPTGLSPKDAIGGLKLKTAPKVRKVNKKGLLVAGSVISIALILSTMWSGPDVSAAAQKKAEDDKKAAMNKPVELSGDTAWYEKASLNSEKNDADSSPKTTEQPATKADTKKGVPNLTGLGVSPMEAATAPTVGAADLSKEDQQTQKAERQQQQQIMQKKMQDLAQAQRAGLSAQGFSQPNTFQQPQNQNANLMGQLASYGGAGAQPAAQQQPELDDQNKQDRKDKFLKNQQSDATVDMDYSSSKLTKPKSPYEVKAGTIVPSVMIAAFPPVIRFSGLSFSYNMSYAIFGAITPPFISYLSSHFGGLAPAHYVALSAFTSVVICGYLLSPKKF
jgi:type IV secretory pathway VirB10-like protein